MVIQRNWKATAADTLQQNSSSEDSNGSWQMPAPAGSYRSHNQCSNNINPPNNVQHRNAAISRQVAQNVLLAMHQRFGSRLLVPAQPYQANSELMANANKSLEILRQNIQASVSREIDQVIKKYIEVFFVPAISNIRENLGDDSVTDEQLKSVCCSMLEEAKCQYSTSAGGSGSPTSRNSSPVGDLSDSESSNGIGLPRTRCIAGTSAKSLNMKRKESDTDSEASQSTSTKRQKTRTLNKALLLHPSPCSPSRMRGKRDGYKWNSARLGPDTLFIMGSKANKVLGLGQTRGRLYAKHPDLLRYPVDVGDKEWLAQNNLMPLVGGKSYLVVLEDIQELAISEEYKHNPNVQFHELKGFKVPDFMCKKIQAFINDHCSEVNSLLSSTFDFFDSDNTSSLSMTPPSITGLDSNPPTPSDGVPISDGRGGFVNLPQMSPNSNTLLSSATTSIGLRHPKSTTKSVLSTSHATLTALLASHSDITEESLGQC